ncbi:uncharacterized protein BX664DRAFT_255587 [Halteromyces radiatus]|uniref:uncharacterized protein n=1 Tax=Halteromyces radiatus TaxID=101107 RepID=UPI00221F7A1C|nr:uncharacterized protein BX664DRAFT_255587 [Halteromyces radiatus]KAI8099702.1 hypothetical protein BX664DRAFT_255587 [Halteromyces radiatus]
MDTIGRSTFSAQVSIPHSSVSPNQSYSSSSHPNYLTDERLLEIVENLEDHWRSPPILTPTTVAMIFNNSYNGISPSTPFRTIASSSSSSDMVCRSKTSK